MIKYDIMVNLLKDKTNLRILKEICRGNGVTINLSYLSRTLKKHRNTIKSKVDDLIKHNIINPPVVPFFGLYKEHPLMIIVYADLPHNEQTIEWMKKDKHIFAAFKIRHGQYNTLLLIFHKDILNYHLWREQLTEEKRIPQRDNRTPSEAHFFSNRLIAKYQPAEGLKILRSGKEKIIMNNYKLDSTTFNILEMMLNGEGIRINESALSEKLGMHKKTIMRRIELMKKERLILDPICRFPNFVVPPDCVLQIAKVEINKNTKEVLEFLQQDPHIPLALKICEGRFNFLLFEVFSTYEEHIEWASQVREKFIGSIGMTETTALMEKNTFNIDQQKVSLAAIKNCMIALDEHKDDYFKHIEPGYLLFEE